MDHPPPKTTRLQLRDDVALYRHNWHGENVQNLIIMAHGQIVNRRSATGIFRRLFRKYQTTTPPWTTLFFYAPHGTVTRSWHDYYMVGKYPPLEAYLPGEKVYNYDLSYDSQYTSPGLISTYLRNSRPLDDPDLSHHPFRVFDVLTTPTRILCSISLETILKLLYQTGHVYPRIHCSFCRYEKGTPERDYRPGYRDPSDSWIMVNREDLLP
ncbi:putative adhesin [Endozoicomonas euniceicola]|uniref:Putative adhesin Stv domain-containing protein n=1 Tax=Endozoicomonas euniceicola TaxID=1234143 RepID=A0ABY6GUZ3_9GAMM|nr:hypothetical protein [Endozoicomonas euniceicola]UYM16515.1 hypothetical protein NX720_00850 [Endozoicomonas euniceicola]